MFSVVESYLARMAVAQLGLTRTVGVSPLAARSGELRVFEDWRALQILLRGGGAERVLGIRSPFPFLSPADRLSAADLIQLLGGKYPLRVMMKGGPLAQPAKWVAFRADPDLVQRVRDAAGPFRRWTDYTLPPSLVVGEGHIEDFPQFAERLVLGEVELPVMFKPNYQGLGQGIIFFSRTPGGSLKITMSSAHETPLAEIGGVYVIDEAEHDLLTLEVPFTEPGLAAFLVNLWKKVSVRIVKPEGGNRYVGSYDPGMMESVVVPYRHEEAAFETRHYVAGNLLTGQAELLSRSTWASRIGSSALFSNFGGRKRAKDIRGSDLFRPLFDGYTTPEGHRFFQSDSEKRAFDWYVDRILLESFRYLSLRLRAAGVFLDRLANFEIDLMWLPRPNLFPRPFLTEGCVTPADSQSLQKIRIPNGLRLQH